MKFIRLSRILFILSFVFICASCRNQLEFVLCDDDSIFFTVECNFDSDGVIQKLLQSVGTDFSELNLDELRSGLEEEGFSKVQVYPSASEGLVIKGYVPKDNDIVFQKDGVITFRLTNEKFRNFYNGSSPRIMAVFDMFLVPVLSDDEELLNLDENEYLDLIASFYGQSFSNELSKSSLQISVQDKKKNKTQKTVYFASLFTTKKAIEIKSQN